MVTHQTDNDRILTEDEVAQLTCFSPRTLQAWRQRNVGPPFMKVGRSVRYSYTAVMGWMKALMREPGGVTPPTR